MKIEKIIQVTPGFSHRIAQKTAKESQESMREQTWNR
jgi:hypothetical protein